MTNYAWKKDYDSYIDALRYHPTKPPMVEVKQRSKDPSSPIKDHFVEGQLSIRSHRARNGLAMLNNY